MAIHSNVTGFSALQRAENSSILHMVLSVGLTNLCFSALQRAENSSIHLKPLLASGLSGGSFSALQRAENSSIVAVGIHIDRQLRFSALQRAENSSISTATPT